MGNKEILQEIEDMTVKDLADLVEMIEERFNVSAAAMAPVAVAAAPGAAGSGAEAGEAAAESFKVVLTNPGQKKIQVIKEIKEITGKGLKECKDLVDNLPATIKEGVGSDEATSIKDKLEAAGAEAGLEQ